MHDFLYKEADGRCNWQQSEDDRQVDQDEREAAEDAGMGQKVEEEKKDELLDRILVDIENAQSDGSD